jgi:LETM1 and EF-hand domain-containing protein 1
VNDDHLTSEQFKELEENLTAIAVDEDEGSERKQLEDLKLSRERFAMDHAAEGSKTTKKQLKELDDLIKEMEEYMNAMESERTRNLSDSISSDVKADVTTEQLEAALKMMRHPPDDQRIRKIVKRLDADGDGRVFLQEIISLANEVEELEKQQQDHPSQ